MEDEREEIRKKKQRRKLRNIAILILITLALIGMGINYNILVRWNIPNSPPTIVLIHPANHEVLNNSTTYFLWNSSDENSEQVLSHVWYCDITNTFVSPFARTNTTLGALENYTTEPAFTDGKWYWRVEVTDGTTVNVSETWSFLMKTNATNHFPSLSFPQVLPLVGTTNTHFIYNVWFVDLDNTTPAYLNVSIDGVQHNMTQLDISDTNISDGKSYYYTTSLSVGVHNYLILCSDGVAINSTGLYIGPTVTWEAPPGNGTNGTNPSNPGPDEKMNKITLQPHEVSIGQGGEFTGSLSITEETWDGGEYEVFWYVFLINDTSGEEITYNAGSLAIYTTVVVPYNLLTNDNTPIGMYRIIAKTYDMPRENISVTQLGMDEIPVTITNKTAPFLPTLPTIPNIKDLLDLLDDYLQIIIILGFLLGFVGLLLFAFHNKKYVWVIAAAVCIMIDLILIGIVSQCGMTLLGIPIFVFGALLLTPHRMKIIPNKHVAIAIGAALVMLGIIIYLGCSFWFF